MEQSALLGSDVLLFAAVGLLAGAHCLGMCGPLVTMYAERMDGTATDGGSAAATGATGSADGTGPAVTDARGGHLTLYEVRQHALFNLGRATSYALIGGLMGALGGAVFLSADELTAAAAPIRGTVGVLVGAAVILVGVNYALGRSAAGLHVPGLPLDRLFGVLTSRIDRLAGGPGIVALGGLHGLLPCPILYPAYLYAFAGGSATTGFVLLGALGLGTIPTVFAYGTLIDSVSASRRRQVHRVLGVAFLLLGYIPLSHGLMEFGIHLPHLPVPFYSPFETGMAH
ncbi:sulfite exporter TauE/SafE family protein [Haloparvum sedimenti]|uniref:sulfite exporter TauE/SafE family protein n=1 Tax=Haloparvum sedimenti TaxID=1678448 RepID=UPI00071E9B40|nr:sulfite exporter TauE/SafE family protein [Haloparvum sedimenti]